MDKTIPAISKLDVDKKVLDLITNVTKLPVVRVDRETFLRKHFTTSPYIEEIIKEGPQAVFTIEQLRNEAHRVVKNTTTKTSTVSFATGFASNPIAMVATGGADIAQYFGFALNMAQKIAYLFGEDELFSGESNRISEENEIRIIGYLGAMFGVSGANVIIAKTSTQAGLTIGKKVSSHALTKTTWYPLVKKVASVLGQKITKKSVEKTISKAVPVIGGAISGGLTYVTFNPMGKRLTRALYDNMQEIEHLKESTEGLHPNFIKTLNEKNSEKVFDGSFEEL